MSFPGISAASCAFQLSFLLDPFLYPAVRNGMPLFTIRSETQALRVVFQYGSISTLK